MQTDSGASVGRKVSLAATATTLFVPEKAALAAGSAWTTTAQPRVKAGTATTRNPGPIYLTPKDPASLTAPVLLLKDRPLRILPVPAATQSPAKTTGVTRRKGGRATARKTLADFPMVLVALMILASLQATVLVRAAPPQQRQQQQPAPQQPHRLQQPALQPPQQQVLLQPAQQLHLQLATLPVQQQSNALSHFQGLRDSASGVSAVQKVLPSLSSTWNTLAARLLQSLASPLFVTVRVVPAAQNATTSPAHQRVKAGTATTRRLRLHFLKALPALMMVLVVEFQDIHQ